MSKKYFWVLIVMLFLGSALVFAGTVDAQDPVDPPISKLELRSLPALSANASWPTPTPWPGEEGNVSGKILFAGEAPPIGQFQLGLCEVNGWFCEYSKPGSPLTQYLEDGSFRFMNVPAGRYGLVMDFEPFCQNPFACQVLLEYPGTRTQIVFTVDGDYDIGTLAYDNKWCSVMGNCVWGLYMPVIGKEE